MHCLQYKRVAIETQHGPAYAYEYVGKDWDSMPPIADGDYLKYVRDQGHRESMDSDLSGATDRSANDAVPQDAEQPAAMEQAEENEA